MANTLSVALQLTLANAGMTISAAPSNSITLTGANFQGNVQNIGTSSEALTETDITTLGYVFLKNLDATNFVSISVVNPAVAGSSFCRLLPGEWCFVPTRLAMYAIADTGAIDLQIVAAEL